MTGASAVYVGLDCVRIEQERGNGTDALIQDSNFSVMRVHVIDMDMEAQARVEMAGHIFAKEGNTEQPCWPGGMSTD